MRPVRLLLLALVITACDKKLQPETPTAPASPATRNADKSGTPVALEVSRQSPVCRSYQKQRTALTAQVKQRADEKLLAQDSALAVIIADVCR